jgi:hypothetical protein
MPARVYVCDAKEFEKLKKLMEYDPYLDKSLNDIQLTMMKKDKEANIIFARQDYHIKDGISVNLDTNKYYLYLSANEEFLNAAEPKLKKNIEGIERAPQDIETKVIEIVEGERQASESGIGSIFG